MWWKRRSAIKRGGSIKKDRYEEASLVIRKKQLIKKDPIPKNEREFRYQTLKECYSCAKFNAKVANLSCIIRQFLHHECFLPSARPSKTNGWATWIFNMRAQNNTEAGWLARLLNPNLISKPVWEVLRRHYVPISCQETQVGSLAVSHWEHCHEVPKLQLERPRNTCQHKMLSILSRSHMSPCQFCQQEFTISITSFSRCFCEDVAAASNDSSCRALFRLHVTRGSTRGTCR